MRRLLLALPLLGAACAETPPGPAASATPPPARTAAGDANWAGEMRCSAIPGQTAGTLNAPVTVSVSGGVARYQRDVRNRLGQAAGRGEAGQGRVGPDGSVTLEGEVGASGSRGSGSYTARYAGRLAGDTATLRGEQNWTTQSGPFRRPCTLTLRRA